MFHYLREHRRVELADLVRLRYVLEKLLRDKIGRCRDEAYKAGVQDVLIKMPAVAQLSPAATVVFREGLYPCNNPYRGSFKFAKHFFPLVGAMNGEEIECAKALEMSPAVKVWSATWSGRSAHSGCRPTATSFTRTSWPSSLTAASWRWSTRASIW
jgi:type III restriction enzyme